MHKITRFRPCRFYDGCEQQCKCVGYGDMVCLSRCPPLASPAPGQNCLTLADVSDPCCNITVCDDPVLDPEENVEKESSSSKGGFPTGAGKGGRILWDGEEHPMPEPIPGTSYSGVKLGDFQGFFHDVSGSVYALNQSTLLVKVLLPLNFPFITEKQQTCWVINWPSLENLPFNMGVIMYVN